MSEQENPPTEPQDRQAILKRATTLKQQIEDNEAAGNPQQAAIYRNEFISILQQLSTEDVRLLAGALFINGRGRI